MHAEDERALEALYGSWVGSRSGGYRDAAVWDASAEDYKEFAVPSWNDDLFLGLLADEAPIEGATVLDIGCGTGTYARALAERAAQVIGIDLSGKMVAYARENAAAAGCSNVTFEQGDFRTMDVGGPFDVVIAHLTPAVSDGETFSKMMGLARRYCAIAKPARRTDAVLDELRTLVGAVPGGRAMDDDFLKAFAAVWLAGKVPSVRSYRDVWHTVRPLDVALELYGTRLVACDLDDEQRSKVDDRLRSLAVDGTVRERIDTTVMLMGWNMECELPA